jgi:hypothetical protein
MTTTNAARGSLILAVLVALPALGGCTDWDSTPTKLAREMARIGYGCGQLETAATDDLESRGITAAGTCSVNGQLVAIEAYKDAEALENDRNRRDELCRQAPEPDRALMALPYVRKNNAIIEGVFLGAYDTAPSVAATLWNPIASGIATATKGQVARPRC